MRQQVKRFTGLVLALASPMWWSVAPSSAREPSGHQRKAALVERVPEFRGTVALTWDVAVLDGPIAAPDRKGGSGTAVVSLTTGQTIHDDLGNNNRLAMLYGKITQLSATDIYDYADQGPCTVTTTTPPDNPYSDTSVIVDLDNPETSLFTHGTPWYAEVYEDLEATIASTTGGCSSEFVPGDLTEVWGWSQWVTQELSLASAMKSSVTGRSRLKATQHFDLKTPEVAQRACAADADYYSDCYTTFDISLTYDLTRISPESPESQYPTLRAWNDRRGRDVLEVRTSPLAKNRGVVFFEILPYGAYHVLGKGVTDAKGVTRLVVPDKHPNGRRPVFVLVYGTSLKLPGHSLIRRVL